MEKVFFTIMKFFKRIFFLYFILQAAHAYDFEISGEVNCKSVDQEIIDFKNGEISRFNGFKDEISKGENISLFYTMSTNGSADDLDREIGMKIQIGDTFLPPYVDASFDYSFEEKSKVMYRVSGSAKGDYFSYEDFLSKKSNIYIEKNLYIIQSSTALLRPSSSRMVTYNNNKDLMIFIFEFEGATNYSANQWYALDCKNIPPSFFRGIDRILLYTKGANNAK